MRPASSLGLADLCRARRSIGLPLSWLGLAQVFHPGSSSSSSPPQSTTRQREGLSVNQEACVVLIGCVRPLLLNQLAAGRSQGEGREVVRQV